MKAKQVQAHIYESEVESIALLVSGDTDDANYDLRFNGTGWTCTCKAWRFSKKKPKQCKHIPLGLRIYRAIKEEFA